MKLAVIFAAFGVQHRVHEDEDRIEWVSDDLLALRTHARDHGGGCRGKRKITLVLFDCFF